MLTLFPILVLLAAAVAIVVVHNWRPNYSYTWLIASGATLLAWAFILAERWLHTAPFSMLIWQPGGSPPLSVLIQIGPASWPFAFSLTTLLLASILTASGRLELQVAAWMWAGSLVIIGTGLMGVMAGNALTFILAWTLIDVVEIAFVLRNLVSERFEFGVGVVFLTRLLGSMLVVWALMSSPLGDVSMRIEDAQPEMSLFLVLAAVLRLGVFPIRLPYAKELRERRGLGTLIRLVAPASAFALLGRLPVAVIPTEWASLLLAIGGVGAFFGALIWLVSDDELNGRPFLLLYFGSLALVSVVRGQPLAAVTWGVTLILMGGLAFLHSLKGREFLAVSLVGFISISGLPFTPAAAGWLGLIQSPFSFWSVFFPLSHAVMLMGYLRHTVKMTRDEASLERWVYVVYPVGLGLLVLVQWFLSLSGWSTPLNAGVLWASIPGLVLALLGSATLWRWLPGLSFDSERISWLVVLGGRVRKFFVDVLTLKWLFWLIRGGYTLLQQIIRFGTEILEGDGGVLWALLLLTLLISLVIPGGNS